MMTTIVDYAELTPTQSSSRGEVENGGTRILTIRDIEDLIKWVLEEYGLTALGWSFAWDRAIRRAGCCHHVRRQITLSRPIFEIADNREEVLDTILHEAAHALVGPGVGHGPRWKAVAASIGARPERCHSLAVPAPFLGFCRCDRTYSKVRRPDPSAAYRCPSCSAPITWVESTQRATSANDRFASR